MPELQIHINGVSGRTGEYLVPPMSPSQVAALARRPPADPDAVKWVDHARAEQTKKTYGFPYYMKPERLDSVGWGVVFSSKEDQAVIDALAPLIEWRARQTGNGLLKVLEYDPAESWRDWMDHLGLSPGNIDPRKVPYYILLVGSPNRIPFSFQYLLDVDYAVGRLDLDDPESYRRYANSVIASEQGDAAPRDRTAVFFGTRHDEATRLSADLLIGGLAKGNPQEGDPGVAVREGFRPELLLGPSATKANLEEVLAGSSRAGSPALIFSATHGIGDFPPGHPGQAAKHGALLCQDWPGVGRMSSATYFAAADLEPRASVHGLVAFLFACFGAGTPLLDDYWRGGDLHDAVLAEEPFTASLPKALLSHPQGGALAVIGHIDRAADLSFYGAGGSQVVPFYNALGRTLQGERVGHAMRDMNSRYAELSADLTALLSNIKFGTPVADDVLARAWTERNDAQNYILLGDPAVRLHLPP